MDGSARVIDCAADQDAPGDQRRHPPERDDEEHRNEDELRRHGETGADLEVEPEGSSVCGDEEDDHKRVWPAVGQREERGRREGCDKKAPAERERGEAFARRETAGPPRAEVADSFLDRGIEPGPGCGDFGHVARGSVTGPRLLTRAGSNHSLQGWRAPEGVIASSASSDQSQRRRETVAKRPLFALVAALCALAPAAPAQAGSLLSGVLPGIVSPSDTPSTCDTAASQPFARWGDMRSYVLVPGGAFEPGSAGWKLSGGAKVASGNEPFYVHSTADRYSLYLPKGSSATTPPMC